ncbi:MAG: response regulator [Candidatus Saccharimonadales bacterium]
MASILIVEDDRWLADCYRRWLEKANHAVRHTTDAQGALWLIDEEAPELILLDMLLPQANGVQLLHELRSYPDLMHTPVVICSNALPANTPDLGEYGVKIVLDKGSLTPTKLYAAIDEVLAHAAPAN